MKKISYLTLVSFILLSGCANQSVSPTTDSKTSGNSEYETISGIAEETKDGYYLDGNVLEHNVIEKIP